MTRVLLIDDNPDIYRVLSQLLSISGGGRYQLEPATGRFATAERPLS